MADLVMAVTVHHMESGELRHEGRSHPDAELWSYLKELVRDARPFYRRKREVGEEECNECAIALFLVAIDLLSLL